MNRHLRILILTLLSLQMLVCRQPMPDTVVIISANAEWEALKEVLPSQDYRLERSPYGEYFIADHKLLPGLAEPVIFLHGGWGRIDAAASAQWAISEFQPDSIINLGTAGGFEGRIRVGQIVFASKTIVYDIIERMGSASEAIQDYTTEIKTEVPPELKDLVVSSTIISADQDIDPSSIRKLTDRYDAVAADWESASIGRVADKNGLPIIILRGISDVVSPQGSLAYGDIEHFEEQTRALMRDLLDLLQRIR